MAEAPPEFRGYAAIDWSGAAGARHKGLAVATCAAGSAAPRLVRPGHVWSREEVLAWLGEQAGRATLVGLDLGLSFPFADRAAFFPGWTASPGNARALWALVERLSAADPHLAATGFVDHPEASRHFRRHGGRKGERFGAEGGTGGSGRFRVTEQAQRTLGCRPCSVFNLVGAAQVGKASLTGMRVLHRLPRQIAVWPFDPLPPCGTVVVEIYTTIAAMAAGRPAGRSKIRTVEELNAALARMASAPVAGSGAIDDHRSDALLAAAWLRHVAHDRRLWNPRGLDPVRHTEGWTFGVP